jgi:hypothetical protein
MLARVRNAADEVDEAGEFFALAADVRTKTLGPAHPKTLDSLATLADFHIARKNHAEAEKPLRAIIEVRGKLDGDSAESLTKPLEQLAEVLDATDRKKEGDELRGRAAKIREAVEKAAAEAKETEAKAKKVAEAQKAGEAAAQEAKPALAK